MSILQEFVSHNACFQFFIFISGEESSKLIVLLSPTPFLHSPPSPNGALIIYWDGLFCFLLIATSCYQPSWHNSYHTANIFKSAAVKTASALERDDNCTGTDSCDIITICVVLWLQNYESRKFIFSLTLLHSPPPRWVYTSNHTYKVQLMRSNRATPMVMVWKIWYLPFVQNLHRLRTGHRKTTIECILFGSQVDELGVTTLIPNLKDILLRDGNEGQWKKHDIFLARKTVFTTTKQIGFRQPNSVPVLQTRKKLYWEICRYLTW